MVDPQFWYGKKVFITGHTGFKGSWLTLWMSSMGAEVMGYSLLPTTTPDLFHIANIKALCSDSIIGDITDYTSLLQAISDYQPEVVFHLAAQSIVKTSYVDPIHTFLTNVIGTAYLLEAVRNTGSVHVVVNVTSDKCYLNNRKGGSPPFQEHDPLGGRDPYSASKACAEIVTASYQQSYFQEAHGTPLKLASARAGNVIGGGDWAATRLFPDIIRAYTHSIPLTIRNPDSIRPWQHVLDSLHGYIILAEKLWADPQYVGAWNFGPLDPAVVTVNDIVRMAASIWKNKLTVIPDTNEAPYEAPILILDSRKAAQTLGWRSKLSTKEAVEWTILWYQQYTAGKDARYIAEQQIAAFINL